MDDLSLHAQEVAAEAAIATAGSQNEATLRHELEGILERHCRAAGIPWTPFQLELPLFGGAGDVRRYADVAHGAVLIEYEAPASFAGREGARLKQARQQLSEYALLLQREEGRRLGEYVLAAWDGSHLSFGRFEDSQPTWQRLLAFTPAVALQLLQYLREDGIPLVHPQLLSQVVGPESAIGARLIPAFFQAIHNAGQQQESESAKTRLLFIEWKRLFGQVAGVQSARLQRLLDQQGQVHSQPYADDPATYPFALNTYIALVAKLVAALLTAKRQPESGRWSRSGAATLAGA